MVVGEDPLQNGKTAGDVLTEALFLVRNPTMLLACSVAMEVWTPSGHPFIQICSL